MSRAVLGNLQNWLYCLVCALFVPVILTENTVTSSLGTAIWEAGTRACSVSMSIWKGGPTHHCSCASGWELCKDKEFISAALRQRILEKESFRVLDSSEKRIYTHMEEAVLDYYLKEFSIYLIPLVFQLSVIILQERVCLQVLLFLTELSPVSWQQDKWPFLYERFGGFFSSSSVWNYSMQRNQRKRNQWMLFSTNHEEN